MAKDNLPRIKDYKKFWEVHDSIYLLEFNRHIPDEEHRVLGICDPSTKQIHIRLKQSRRDILKTFLHELLHAFEFEYGIKIPHKTIYELEEPILDFLERNFF